MRIAILSDIHGNRHAFETVIAAAREAGADELWCLGDIVGYGADPTPASPWPPSIARSASPGTTIWPSRGRCR
jgi:hypothetical protein